MKVRYPLSLRISLWLLLNLLLLAAVLVAFAVFQGGLGWGALVAGPLGDKAQAKVGIIANELAAAPADKRGEVIQRFDAAYGVSVALVRLDDVVSSAGALALPGEIVGRLEASRPLRRPFGRGGRGEFGPRAESDGAGPEGQDSGRKRKGSKADPDRGPAGIARDTVELPPRRDAEPERRLPPPEALPGLPGGPRDARFILRAGVPAAYWAAFRVPFISGDRERPGPAVMVVRLDSFWNLLRFLELESWLLAGTGVLLVSILFWLPLVRGITRALRELTAATERIAEGRFDTRVGLDRRDELGLLGDSVNRMATRLDSNVTGQKRFLGDVAHELCSPLARLQLATGILGEQAPAPLQPAVADIRDEVQQLSALVNELLDFTRSGLQARAVTCVALELRPVVEAAIDREGTGARTTVEVPPGLQASAEAGLLGRALGNLLRNAARYAGPASPIRVSARSEAGRVVLAVEDEGPGVAPEALDRLGEPFFRPEDARTRESGGVGLGLAIVRSSAAALGGEVRFSNRTPRGFRAELRLAAA